MPPVTRDEDHLASCSNGSGFSYGVSVCVGFELGLELFYFGFQKGSECRTLVKGFINQCFTLSECPP